VREGAASLPWLVAAPGARRGAGQSSPGFLLGPLRLQCAAIGLCIEQLRIEMHGLQH
jgi:hypothetical protein